MKSGSVCRAFSPHQMKPENNEPFVIAMLRLNYLISLIANTLNFVGTRTRQTFMLTALFDLMQWSPNKTFCSLQAKVPGPKCIEDLHRLVRVTSLKTIVAMLAG